MKLNKSRKTSKMGALINKNQKKTIVCLSLGLMFICIAYILYTLTPIPRDILLKYFGKSESILVIFWTYISALAAFAIYQTLETYHQARNKEFNKWFWGTVLLIITLLIPGLVFIDSFFGYQEIGLVLRETQEKSIISGEIHCSTPEGILLADAPFQCSISPKLNNSSIKLTAFFRDGSQKTITLKNKSFTSQIGVQKIKFNITGTDESGKNRSLEVTQDIHFYTEKEYQLRNKVIKYFLIFFGFLILTVPSAMLNLKKLTESDLSETGKHHSIQTQKPQK